jgi:trigger factor
VKLIRQYMNVEVTRLPESRVELKIQLTPDEVDQALDRTYKELVQRVNIPGFRKGKAPRPVVERVLGHEAFLHEATDDAIRWGYRRAVDQESLTPIDQADIHAHGEDGDHVDRHLEPGQPFNFEATVAVKPEVELPDYHGLHLDVQVEDVTDQDVNSVLEDIRARNATLEPTVRAAQIGDVVTMNITGRAGGEEVVNDENAEFELLDEEAGEAHPALPGLSAQLVGENRGDIKEVALELPELYRDPELAGKTLFLRVLVKEIKRKVLADLDDEFAKTVSEFQTLDELRAALRRNLELERKLEADEKVVQQAVQEVTSRTFIDIPPLLIEEEQDRMLDDMRQAFERRGLSFQTYLDTSGRTETEIKNEMRDSASNNVKVSLVLGAVADAEGISVSNAEIATALEDLFRSTGVGNAERRQMRTSTTVRSNLRNRIRRQRALERLVGIMTGDEQVAREAEEAVADDTVATAQNAEETVAVEVGG